MENEDKKLLIKTINKRGFILEDRTWKIIKNHPNLRRIARGLIPRKFKSSEGERAEIDVVGVIGNKHFVIECKHTDYSWIFPKSFDRPNTINTIYGFPQGLIISSRPTSDFKTVFVDLPIMINENGSLKKESRSDYAQTSFKDVYDHIGQLLRNLKAYLYDELDMRNQYYVPIIVTNANLYFFDYDETDIDNKGDFKNFKSLESVPYLIYNFSDLIGEPFPEDEAQMKSIFIININHLEEAIEAILSQRF